MTTKTEWRCNSCHDRRDDDYEGTGCPQDRCLGTYVEVPVEPPKATMTVRDALKHFPQLLDENVTFGSMGPSGVEMTEASTITLQFVGDGNYRTRILTNVKT